MPVARVVGRLQHDRGPTIAHREAGERADELGVVRELPSHRVARLLAAGDEHSAVLAGRDERLADLHRVDHRIAGVLHVHHRAVEAELLGDDVTRGRPRRGLGAAPVKRTRKGRAGQATLLERQRSRQPRRGRRPSSPSGRTCTLSTPVIRAMSPVANRRPRLRSRSSRSVSAVGRTDSGRETPKPAIWLDVARTEQP